MRTITIGTDVFAKIWSLRIQGEDDENAILHRVLGVSQEGKSPKNFNIDPKNDPVSTKRVLWRDDVRQALVELGGEAHLSEIYKKVRSIRQKAGRSLPLELDAIVRRELENNCSQAGAYTGQRDWFRTVRGLGQGQWAINGDSKS